MPSVCIYNKPFDFSFSRVLTIDLIAIASHKGRPLDRLKNLVIYLSAPAFKKASPSHFIAMMFGPAIAMMFG